MMEITRHDIGGTEQLLVDLDLLPEGGSVAVVRQGDEQYLVRNGARLPLPELSPYPRVRARSAEQFVVLDDALRGNQENVWVLGDDGIVQGHFSVGTCVEDFVPFERGLAVTYFDEALVYNHGLSGTAIFDYTGARTYQDHFVHCSCACAMARDRLLYLTYPEFSLVMVDLATHQRSVWAAPTKLYGAEAVTCLGDVAFFHGPYQDQEGIYRLELEGSTRAWRIGAYAGVTRGLPGGRLLTIHADGFTVISLTDELRRAGAGGSRRGDQE